MLLFNPAVLRPGVPRRRESGGPAGPRGLLRGQGPGRDEGRVPRWHLVPGLPGLQRAERGSSPGSPRRRTWPASWTQVRGDGHWDTARINELNEILGFYSLGHWYAWQVSVLGLGPVWTSANEGARKLVGELLAEGGIFGFGLSERTHGADIYSTDMILTRSGDGWVANGGKYYIGNGNEAARLSVFGRFADDDPQRPGEYAFFLVDTAHASYELVKNMVHGQMYVSEFALDDYPVVAADLLHVGRPAWDAALATVNVGKVNLGWASDRDLRALLLRGGRPRQRPGALRPPGDDVPARAPDARRLLRATAGDEDVRRPLRRLPAGASPDDRRFLLYNPIMKMKVTSEGERVIDLLWEVIAARGFEKDTYFESAADRHPDAAEARGHRARQPGARAEVPARVPRWPPPAEPATYDPVPVRRDAG